MKTFKVILKDETQLKIMNVEELERAFNIHYLPHLKFDHWKIERYVRKKCERALKRGAFSPLAIWLGKLHQNELSSARVPDITIKVVQPDVGYGIITNRALPCFHFIGEYTGLVRRRPLFFPNRSLNDYCFAYPREWWTLHPLTIDSEKMGNYTRFINHSDHPNLESVGILFDGVFRILFRTLKKVEAGEELTYNYGDVYWDVRKKLDY